MKISPWEITPEPLAALAMHACELLIKNSISELSEKFGYAISLGRSPATAIQEDLAASLAQLGSIKLDLITRPIIQVKYFKPNNSNLRAVAECSLTTTNAKQILMELVVSGAENEFHATLEQISAAA